MREGGGWRVLSNKATDTDRDTDNDRCFVRRRPCLCPEGAYPESDAGGAALLAGAAFDVAPGRAVEG